MDIAERYTETSTNDPQRPAPLAPQGANEANESSAAFRRRRVNYAGELRRWTNSQPQPRTKKLVCFSFFEEQRLRLKYAIPRAFEPIAFSKTGAGIDSDEAREPAVFHRDRAMSMHASRAVPLETLSEAETVPEIASRYQTPSRMRSNRTHAREALQRWLGSLPPNPPLAEGETEDVSVDLGSDAVYEVDVAAVLLDDVVHRGRVPGVRLGALLARKIGAERVFTGGRAALLVHRPSVGVIAAADDAVVAGDVVFRGVRRNDGQTVHVSLVSHFILPQSTFDRRP